MGNRATNVSVSARTHRYNLHMSATLAFWVSIAALLVSLGSVYYTRRSANTAVAKDRRERTPSLTFTLSSPQPAPIDNAIYRIHNDGPEDLASIVVHRPITPGPDGIIYPIALTREGHYCDTVDVGPLRVSESERITALLT